MSAQGLALFDFRSNPREAAGRIILMLVLTAAALAVLFPFAWMIFTSFKLEEDVFSYPPQLLPQVWTLQNYYDIWNRLPMALYFRNSLIFAGGLR